MRRCCWCSEEKPLDQFHRRGPNGHQAACKSCRKAHDHARYVADPVRHAQIRRSRVRELAAWAFELKRGKPCTDCEGTFHPAAMQWDHVGTDKEIDVADMSNRGYSRARILKEVSKCELVCGNCHAVRTYERRGATMETEVSTGL